MHLLRGNALIKLEDIYRSLKEQNLLQSQYEFSSQWLGKSRSYYSALKAQGRNCTIEPLLALQHKLEQRKLLLLYVKPDCPRHNMEPKIELLNRLQSDIVASIRNRAGQ